MPSEAGSSDDAAQPVGFADGPLSGLVVADLSTVLAGPYCTMLLGDLGADVLKVEPPSGDPTRGYGPPFLGDGREAESTYYLSVNRNKRALRVDLRTCGGREVMWRLLAHSDVLVENFRPGSLARLGFDDAEIERVNPRLVHLAISGFGPEGPGADRPAYDFIIQAASGLMSITGSPDDEGGEPTKVGVAIADLATGMLGATAVLAALHARDRRDSVTAGRGQRIDLSLFESTLAWLANQATSMLLTGVVPGRLGNRHPSITPYETFPTSDGVIAVAVGSEAQWPRLCAALGLGGLAVDRRFATNPDRVRERAVLRPILENRFAERPMDAWLSELTTAGVPASRVSDIREAFADPQASARRMVEFVTHPTLGELRLPGIPFKLELTPGRIRRPPPRLGEHTDDVLAWLGFGPADAARLRADGAV